MSANWIRVHATKDLAEAEILRGLLERNQVPVTLLNRQDSSYVFLGEIELYVPAHLKDLAASLIQGTIGN
jgi:hypothetical protein